MQVKRPFHEDDWTFPRTIRPGTWMPKSISGELDRPLEGRIPRGRNRASTRQDPIPLRVSVAGFGEHAGGLLEGGRRDERIGGEPGLADGLQEDLTGKLDRVARSVL